MSLLIRAEAVALTSHRQTCSGMTELANRLNARIEVEIAGVAVVARPGDNARTLYAAFTTARATGHRKAFAP
jgi:hypothetical protein